jgi:FMN phosphatase YigB (HAD superfamily)
MELRAVLFDLWGTLIVDPEHLARPRQEWRATNVKQVFSQHGIDIDFEAVDAALVKAGAALSELHDGGVDLSSLGRVGLFLRQLEPDIARLVPDAAKPAVERAITSMHPIFRPALNDGSVEVLAAVKAGSLATALICNAGFTTAPNLRSMLTDYGLLPHLDALVFSDELELAKPDTRLFQAALEGVGVPPDNAIFVGDSPHNDIYGATSAGIYAVQIGNRGHTARSGYAEHPGVAPRLRIETLAELLPALRRDWHFPSAA